MFEQFLIGKGACIDLSACDTAAVQMLSHYLPPVRSCCSVMLNLYLTCALLKSDHDSNSGGMTLATTDNALVGDYRVQQTGLHYSVHALDVCCCTAGMRCMKFLMHKLNRSRRETKSKDNCRDSKHSRLWC